MKEWHEIAREKGRVGDRYRCYHCGQLFPREETCGDHYPFSRGARPDLKLDPDNSVCTCMFCNASNAPTRKT